MPMREKLTLQQINERKPPESKLTAIEYCGKRGALSMVKCICECGNTKNTPSYYVSCGWVVSCGCFKNLKTHGLSKHPLYKLWAHVKERCYNKNHKNFDRYGEIGIIMCDEWLNDFNTFYDWSLSNGWAKGLELDRIDNDGIYSPANCRYVTHVVNCWNKPSVIILEYDGKRLNLSQWSDIIGIPPSTIYERFKSGKSIDKILSPNKLKKP